MSAQEQPQVTIRYWDSLLGTRCVLISPEVCQLLEAALTTAGLLVRWEEDRYRGNVRWQAEARLAVQRLHEVQGLTHDPAVDWLPALTQAIDQLTRYQAVLRQLSRGFCERPHRPHTGMVPSCPDDPNRERWCAACLAREALSRPEA